MAYRKKQKAGLRVPSDIGQREQVADLRDFVDLAPTRMFIEHLNARIR